MPPPDSHKLPLKPEQRALMKRWIEQGAVHQNHWADELVARPTLPAPTGGAQAKDGAIDPFIGAKLGANQLALAPEASREVLLRRLTLDLIGLPPTPQEVDAFSPTARPTLMTARSRACSLPRATASILVGHRLDAARYADTHGLHLDNVRRKHSWPYRDWVVLGI